MPRRPVPRPTPLTEPWWAAAAQGRLVIQHCPRCATYLHPPEPICPRCHGSDLVFRDVSGRGRIYAFTTMTQPRVEGFEDALPLSCIAVELEEQPGLCVLTNLVGAPGEPVVGADVEVTFEPIGDGVVLPQFRLTPRA